VTHWAQATNELGPIFAPIAQACHNVARATVVRALSEQAPATAPHQA